MLGVGRSYCEIFSNTFNVVRTTGSEKEHLGASKELKILVAVAELGVGNIRGSNNLRYLKESWLRPPPGGAHTGTIVVSMISLKNNFCLS